MMAFTHIAAGSASAVGLAVWMDLALESGVYLLAGGVIGSLLPDVDHPASSFGKRVWPISLLVSSIFGHRGVTHSLIAVAGMTWLAWHALRDVMLHPGVAAPMVAGMAVGYLSHLLGDWMTNSGVPLLWPSRRRFVSPVRFSTGDAVEYVLAFALYGWTGARVLAWLGT